MYQAEPSKSTADRPSCQTAPLQGASNSQRVVKRQEAVAARDQFAWFAQNTPADDIAPAELTQNHKAYADLLEFLSRKNLVADVLLPMLNDPAPEIRCAAASFLLYHGHDDEAASVLVTLTDDENAGIISETAKNALRIWRSHTTSAQVTPSAEFVSQP